MLKIEKTPSARRPYHICPIAGGLQLLILAMEVSTYDPQPSRIQDGVQPTGTQLAVFWICQHCGYEAGLPVMRGDFSLSLDVTRP